MSPKAGYISTEDNWSANFMTGQDPPDLSRLSDIYFLIWQQMANGKELKNIKYFMRFHIQNSESIKVAKEACNQDIPEWPGKPFEMDTDEGQAILATPNGGGVAWFLIHHKKDLGVKCQRK